MIKLLQWNCCGLQSKKSDLEYHIASCNIDIFAIQETWLQSQHNFQVSNFNIIRADRISGTHGGLLFGIKSSFNFFVHQNNIYDSNSDLEYQRITISINNLKFDIIQIYHPSGNLLPSDIDFISSFSSPFILLGDFNCHHYFFRSYKNNAGGNMLFDWYLNNKIQFLNRSSPTHLHKDGKSCSLDLSFMSYPFVSSVEWTISSSSMGSDHLPIIINISSNSPKFKMQKITHWNMLCSLLNSTPESQFSTYSSFVNFLLNSINMSSESKPRPTSVISWWNSDCRKALSARKKALSLARKHLSVFYWVNFKKSRSFARRTFNSAKREAWGKFIASISNFSLQKIFNVLKKHRSPSPNSSFALEINSVLTFDVYEQISAFGKLFESPTILVPITSLNHPNIDSDINDYFSLAELNLAINKSRNSAAGPDGIPSKIFKILSPNHRQLLLSFLNQIWSSSILPASWKSAYVVPILKGGKNSSLLSSYRPISITSSLCKLQERLILNRLNKLTSDLSFFHNYQFGFLAGKSSIDCLLSILHEIHLARVKKYNTFLCCLDLKSAYDLIHRPSLLLKLSSLIPAGRCFNWITSFLTNRVFKIKWQNTLSADYVCNLGVQQGSILSPFLFNLFLRDIFSIIPAHSQLFIYADDLFLLSSHRSLSTASLNLQESLNKIIDWCNTWKMKISTSKSKIINFSTYRHPSNPAIYVNSDILEWVQEAKILGIHVHRSLKWRLHFRKLLFKGNLVISILKQLAYRNQGPNSLQLLKLLKCNLLPAIEYGSPIFSHYHCPERKKLATIINSAIRIATGLPRSCHNLLLYSDWGMFPLDSRLEVLSAKFYIKQIGRVNCSPFNKECADFYEKNSSIIPKRFKENILYQMHTNTGQFFRPNTPCFRSKISFLDSSRLDKVNFFLNIFNSKCSVMSETAILQIFRSFWNENCINSFNIFLDGSKNSSGCGFGVFIPHLNIRLSFPLPFYFSIFSAESTALQFALDNYCTSNDNFFIFSDSKSVLLALKYLSSSSSILSLLFQSLMRSNRISSSINLIWIPSHKGIMGNEIADSLAKKGANLPYVEIKEFPCMYEDLQLVINNSAKQFILNHWETTLFQRFPYINGHNSWLCNFSRSRGLEILINKLRANSAPLNYFLFKIKQIDSPNCSFCLVPETSDHYITHCFKYVSQRSIFLKGIPQFFRSFQSRDIFVALYFFPEAIELLESFILNTKRFQ